MKKFVARWPAAGFVTGVQMGRTWAAFAAVLPENAGFFPCVVLSGAETRDPPAPRIITLRFAVAAPTFLFHRHKV